MTDISDGTWSFYDAARAFPSNQRHWDSPNIVAEFNIGLDAAVRGRGVLDDVVSSDRAEVVA